MRVKITVMCNLPNSDRKYMNEYKYSQNVLERVLELYDYTLSWEELEPELKPGTVVRDANGLVWEVLDEKFGSMTGYSGKEYLTKIERPFVVMVPESGTLDTGN